MHSRSTFVSQAPAFYYDLLLSPLRNAQTCVASCLVPVRRATIVALRVPMWSSQSLCGCEPFSSWASSIRADPIPSFLSALGAKRTSPACRTPCTPAFLVRKGSIYVLTRERGRRYSWLAGWLEELRLGLLATSTLYIEHPGYPSSVPRPLLDPVKRDSRVRALRSIVNAHSERDRGHGGHGVGSALDPLRRTSTAPGRDAERSSVRNILPWAGSEQPQGRDVPGRFD